jgi:hypothetical protein
MDDIIALTTFFNSCHYKTKSDNYKNFRQEIKNDGIKLMTIECAFGNDSFELTENDTDILIQVRCDSKIWQKERLLNIGISQIPDKYTKYCTLDCDLIFTNKNWVKETSELLDDYCVVQPFSNYEKLNKNGEVGSTGVSFIKEFHDNGCKVSDRYSGHTGYAWAYRLDTVNELYDKMIVGGGDSIMGYTYVNSGLKNWVRNISPKHLQKDIDTWAKGIQEKVQANVFYTSGTVKHLWHGESEHRYYDERQSILSNNDFNPLTNLWYGEDECWETTDKLKEQILIYFKGRKEDGV